MIPSNTGPTETSAYAYFCRPQEKRCRFDLPNFVGPLAQLVFLKGHQLPRVCPYSAKEHYFVVSTLTSTCYKFGLGRKVPSHSSYPTGMEGDRRIRGLNAVHMNPVQSAPPPKAAPTASMTDSFWRCTSNPPSPAPPCRIIHQIHD